MKFSTLLDVLMDVLQKRKVTASELAEKYETSTRTIYRYVDELSFSVPIYVKRGRGGGICISDNYRLPVGFMNQTEYTAAIEALDATYAQLPEERFLSAKKKLTASRKPLSADTAFVGGESSTLLIDGGTWGDTQKFADKMRYISDCIHRAQTVEIEYRDRAGVASRRKIQPHLLILKQNVWYVYAYCLKQKDFRLFRLGRIYATFATGETFTRKAFKKEDLPLHFWVDESEAIDVRLQVDETALLDVQDWLGVENVKQSGEKWTANVRLPNDGALPKKIIGFGAGVTVLSPQSLKDKIKAELTKTAALYE
ncbi:MAG: YafY family transcriptional regulator [Clostridia bacterium]|nr:YafY family transcriptional regulator [Clostridia bacterium]